MQIALGSALAAIVALTAYRANALTSSGALAAFAIGAIVFGTGGWPGAAVLFAFFLPSTLLSHLGRERKRALDGRESAPRNGWQVLANGSVAAVCAFLATHGSAPFAAAFAGAFAAASADTWGTEIGTLSRRNPVSILTFRPVRAGLSGGVTLLGTFATLAGALGVASVASAVHVASLGTVALGGVAGALLDSILGASLQALRWCPACACACEATRHHCGNVTVMRRGLRWIGNDLVNFAATLAGAAIAALAVL